MGGRKIVNFVGCDNLVGCRCWPFVARKFAELSFETFPIKISSNPLECLFYTYGSVMLCWNYSRNKRGVRWQLYPILVKDLPLPMGPGIHFPPLLILFPRSYNSCEDWISSLMELKIKLRHRDRDKVIFKFLWESRCHFIFSSGPYYTVTSKPINVVQTRPCFNRYLRLKWSTSTIKKHPPKVRMLSTTTMSRKKALDFLINKPCI